MYQRTSVSLLNLLLSLSDALDLADPNLNQHQLRTAFVAWELGRTIELPSQELDELFIAALLHDIGGLSPEEKIDIHQHKMVDPRRHCLLGEKLLRNCAVFERTSEIVRHHHTKWIEWGSLPGSQTTLASQILLLADTLERRIDRKKYILHQSEDLICMIERLSGTAIDPSVVEAFRLVAIREDFWFDLVSSRLYSLLLRYGPCQTTTVDLWELRSISELFRNMIDFRSRFTSTHSTGVATSAAAIARFFGLSDLEIELMEVAGNLHDLGKLIVPSSILTKPGKLTKDETAIMRQHTYLTYNVLTTIRGVEGLAEWAAFHHERLDGSGYPFHLTAKDLNVGARIMATADIFTALAEDRPYRNGLNQAEVMEILTSLCHKNHIDRNVVHVLEKNYDEIYGLTKRRQDEIKEYFEREFCVEFLGEFGD